MSKVNVRPPGHYTALITSLQRWIEARHALGLDCETLAIARTYIEEARDMANALRGEMSPLHPGGDKAV